MLICLGILKLEEIMNKKDLALTLRQQGYNCSQTMLCTFAEDFGLDQAMAYRLSEGLGGGFGGRRELCGAVNAMSLILSLHLSKGPGTLSKHETMAGVNQAVCRFIDKNGSHCCQQLKAENDEHRSCTDLILDCVEITEELLKEGKGND